jgi:hypothetical protein
MSRILSFPASATVLILTLLFVNEAEVAANGSDIDWSAVETMLLLWWWWLFSLFSVVLGNESELTLDSIVLGLVMLWLLGSTGFARTGVCTWGRVL